MAASKDKNDPRYTTTPLNTWSSAKNILASKPNQIAAPKKAKEEINSPVDLLRRFIL